MIRELGEIIHKNFIRLWRSKISTFSIIIIPFLIILFAGFAFDSSGLSEVNVGVYSDSYSSLSEDILITFEQQNFYPIKFDSLEECIGAVSSNEAQICIFFPKDLSEKGNSESITFYVDYSRTNIAYTLIEDMKSRISFKSSDLGISLAQNLITVLEDVKSSLPEEILKLEASKENLEYIVKKAVSEISLEDLNTALEYLDSAKKISEDTEVDDYLQDTMDLLNLVILSKLSVDDNFQEISKKSESTIFILKEVSNRLDLLISEIESSNNIDAEEIASPIKVEIESINSSSKNRDFLLPTIISLIALFGALLLSSTFILKERKSRAYFRNFMTPVRNITFLLGNYLTCLIILVVQFSLVFIGIRYVLNFSLQGIFGQISLILFIAISTFIFIGMFIGYIFKSEETTIFLSVLIAVLMTFFSNAILPIETISSSFKNVALFNPLVICESLLKKVILFGFDYSSLSEGLYILGAFFLGFAILSYFARKFSKRIL
jgi:ABC-type multidrug transport system permease subunit